MADPIRPFVPGAFPTRTTPAQPANARSAQAAFFAQALGRAQEQAQVQAAPTMSAAPSAPAASAVTAAAEPAPVQRGFRPGSLLDIKV